MLIEFSAPPGSGKSTVSKAWSRVSEAAGIKIQRAVNLSFFARKKLILKTRFQKSSRGAHNEFVQFCRQNCHHEASAFSAKLIKDIVRYNYWRNRDPEGFVVFDESISQQFLLLCMRSNIAPELLVDSYVRLMPCMDAIVTLAVPEEVSLARLWQRNPHQPYFFGAKPREEALRLLTIAVRACALFTDAAERKGIRVIRCDGLAAPEENARKVAALLDAPGLDLRRAA